MEKYIILDYILNECKRYNIECKELLKNNKLAQSHIKSIQCNTLIKLYDDLKKIID